MMFIKAKLRTACLLGASLLLGSCGGGSTTTPSPPSAPELQLTPQATKLFHFSWTDVSGETEYRLLEDPDGDGPAGYSQVAAIAADASAYDLPVFLPGRVNARYILQACAADACTDSQAVPVVGHLSKALGYVKASNTGGEDRFGGAMALSSDGSTLVVGAIGEASAARGIAGDQTNNSAQYSGAVYVFVRDGNAWSQQAYVKASNAEAYDDFGYSLALSADGNTMVVGAPGEESGATGIDGDQDDNSVGVAGAVYVFVREGGTWRQQAYMKSAYPGYFDRFGTSVALASDGNTLAVGSPGDWKSPTEGHDNRERTGAVYLFTRVAGAWTQSALVKASNARAGWSDGDDDLGGDEFGQSIALSADGNTLAVGALLEDSSATGIDGDQGDSEAGISSGAAYVFVRNAGIWSQQAYIKASDSKERMYFGLSIALAADGNTLAVGSFESYYHTIGTGNVYLFDRVGDSWHEQTRLTGIDDGDRALAFGKALSLAADGRTLGVGAYCEGWNRHGINDDRQARSVNCAGAAYVFTRGDGGWSRQAYVKASNTRERNLFGYAVSLAGDGHTLAVGAYGEGGSSTGINGDQSQGLLVNAGAVYLY